MLKHLALSLCLLYSLPLFAGEIKLDADERVEYHQKEQKLIAKGNAIASKDNMSIKASTLIGYYDKTSKNKITKVEAYDNVEMKTPQADAKGNKLIYDISTDSAVLTGAPAIIKTPDSTITSQGPITYYQSEQKAIARDNVIATDAKGNKVYADLMTAWFTKDKDGKMTLEKIDIEKNVKITSTDTTVTALTGTYYAAQGKIKLFDNVVINQKGNILKGSQAETDLNSGIRKLLSGGKSGRVSGVFKEKKKKE